MNNTPIEIDGSVLEGGGQIIRNSLSLACILGQPIRITKIRAGRPKPGLSAQHLQGVGLLKQICNAKVSGDFLKSTELEFHPGKIIAGKYTADAQTAGSVALMFQVSLPVAIFSNALTTLHLKGGTNASMAPQIDFTTEIFRPNLEKFGASFDFDLHRRGYFPKGGGHCEFTIQPIKQLTAVTMLDSGTVSRLFGWSFVAGSVLQHIAKEMTDGAVNHLNRIFKGTLGTEHIDIESYKESPKMAVGNCSGIVLGIETTTACVMGGSALGGPREKPHETGCKAAIEIEECIRHKACVDSHVQDQLIIFMALAEGKSQIKTTQITSHTRTAIFVAELLTKAKFNVIEDAVENCIIECVGIGFKNQFI